MVAWGGSWQGPGEAKGDGPLEIRWRKPTIFCTPEPRLFRPRLRPSPNHLRPFLFRPWLRPSVTTCEFRLVRTRTSPWTTTPAPAPDDNTRTSTPDSTRTRIRRYLHPTPKTTTNISLGWPN